MNELEKSRNASKRCRGRRGRYRCGVFRDNERCGRRWLGGRSFVGRHGDPDTVLDKSTSTMSEGNSVRRRRASRWRGRWCSDDHL